MLGKPFRCQFCDIDAMIQMQDQPDGKKAIAINVSDGSIHKHVKHSKPQQQEQQQPRQDTIIREHLAVTRDKAIAEAHDENIEANYQLRAAIMNQTEQLEIIGKQLSALNDLIRAYLETVNRS